MLGRLVSGMGRLTLSPAAALPLGPMFTPVRCMSAKKKAALKEMAQDSLKNEQQEAMTKRFAHVLDANLLPAQGELPENTEESLEDARVMTLGYAKNMRQQKNQWEKAEMGMVRARQAAIAALPEELRADAESPDWTPLPGIYPFMVETPSAQGFSETMLIPLAERDDVELVEDVKAPVRRKKKIVKKRRKKAKGKRQM